MSVPTVKSTLMEIGLSDRESDLYVYLAKTGHQTAARIAKGLHMHKAQVYYILRNLERRGIVETTFTTPAQFSMLPLEQLLQRHIQSKEEALDRFKHHQLPHVLSQWDAMTHSRQQPQVDAFMVIEGHEHTHAKVRQMLLDAQREIIGIGNVFGMTRSQRHNVIETANAEAERKGLTYRLIVEIDPNREDEQAPFLNALGPRFHVRHRDINAQFLPQFIVKDDDEALLFLWPSDTKNQDAKGLWSNNAVIINALKVLYEGLWEGAVALEDQKRVAAITNLFNVLRDEQKAKEGKMKYIAFIEIDPKNLSQAMERTVMMRARTKKLGGGSPIAKRLEDDPLRPHHESR